MTKTVLTDRGIKALKAKPSSYVAWDAALASFGLRVFPSGAKSFVVVRRPAGSPKPDWTTLGRYPEVGLAEARIRAQSVLGVLAEGKTLAQADADQQAAEEAASRTTFSAVASQYVREKLPQRRSARFAEAVVRRHLLPALGHKPLGQIRRADIIALVQEIVARGIAEPGRRLPRSGGRGAARRALAELSALYRWALVRGIDGLEANPCTGIEVHLLGPATPRDRVLTAPELRAVWQAADAMAYPVGTAIKLMLLTGQRRDEIARASWGEIDLNAAVMTLPAARMKGKVAHSVPLTSAAVTLLRGVPRFTGGDFVFSTTAGRHPIGQFTKATTQARELAGIADWQLRDLRRTVRTGLSQSGIMPFIAELVIAHTQTGVHRVYDRFTYDKGKRTALVAWEKYLLEVVK
jgi:integrase